MSTSLFFFFFGTLMGITRVDPLAVRPPCWQCSRGGVGEGKSMLLLLMIWPLRHCGRLWPILQAWAAGDYGGEGVK